MDDLTNIVLENKNLIYKVVNKYSNYFDKDDLFQVGVIGLINAYKNYNPEFDTKFSSYAYFYIYGEIKKYIRENNLLKVSKDLIKLNSLIGKAKEILEQKLLKEVTLEEISAFLEVDIEKLRQAQEITSIIELDAFIDEEATTNLYNMIKYEEKSFQEEFIDLKNALESLSDFDKELIKQRYSYEKTQNETSKALGITQVKVSRLEKQILTRLRTRLK